MAFGTLALFKELGIVISRKGGNAAFHGVDDSLKFDNRAVSSLAKGANDIIHLVSRSVKKGMQCLFGKIRNRHIQRKAVAFSDSGDEGTAPAVLPCTFETVGYDGPLRDGKRAVGNQFVRGNMGKLPESGTARAGAAGIVKGEHSRLQFPEADIVFFTGKIL